MEITQRIRQNLWIVCGLLLSGCWLISYENQAYYELEVGDLVEIYYSTNSCCYYCFSKQQNLEHLEFIEQKTVDSGPPGCAGCNYTSAYVFMAKSVGVDTIKLDMATGGEECGDRPTPLESYVVEIR